MRWRDIGPTRAGRARALAGVPNHPNIFYAGFDNGGVWRSTDYGANWVPLFDDQSTGSIGAIAVAPSNPNIIYVGTGAGIIRPDLAIGNGVYKSTDDGRTWQHLGLRDSQMIAAIAVDPGNPDRALRRRARTSVRAESRARSVPLDRRRTHVREGAVQGRLHERQRGADRSAQPQRPLRHACGRSNRASSRVRDSATPAWASSSPPTAARTGRSSARIAGHSPGEHRDRRERFEHPLRHDRAARGTDRLLQVHRRRRALVPGDSQLPARPRV